MKRSLRYLILFIVGSVVCFLIFFQSRGTSRSPRIPLVAESDVVPGHPHKASVTNSNGETNAHDTIKPKISIIAIWSIHQYQTPSYFPYFFQSVEANPDVDLLFVQVDRAAVGCQTYSNAPNVQELCLTEDQYYQIHADFLCKKWHCSATDTKRLLVSLKRNAFNDKNNSFFRILRGGIFNRFLNDDTTIWGWCDLDTFWGNFGRTFPWDLAGKFDVYIPAGQPEFSNERLLYTRGHMAFFKHSPDVLDRLHSYPKFQTLQQFLLSPLPLVDAEESEFSHFLFSEDDSFTFVQFEGMLANEDTILLASGKRGGVFYTPTKLSNLVHEQRRQLADFVLSGTRTPIVPTLSDDGVEKEAFVFKDGYDFPGEIWFDQKWATHVRTGWISPEEREQKAYFMRREPYGPIVQRREPRERYLKKAGDIVVDECMYKHWQVEKTDSEWIKRLSHHHHLKPREILVQDGMKAVEIWNSEGETVQFVRDLL